MDKRWSLLIAAAVLCTTAGCRLVPPSWFHPGTARQQQLRAQQFDPYTDVESAPEVVGGRPLEYEKPPPEAVRARPNELRARWLPWEWGR